jgi:hypothetical protein
MNSKDGFVGAYLVVGILVAASFYQKRIYRAEFGLEIMDFLLFAFQV